MNGMFASKIVKWAIKTVTLLANAIESGGGVVALRIYEAYHKA